MDWGHPQHDYDQEVLQQTTLNIYNDIAEGLVYVSIVVSAFHMKPIAASISTKLPYSNTATEQSNPGKYEFLPSSIQTSKVTSQGL